MCSLSLLPLSPSLPPSLPPSLSLSLPPPFSLPTPPLPFSSLSLPLSSPLPLTLADIEYAVTTEEMDSLLFEIIKFLLQVNTYHLLYHTLC